MLMIGCSVILRYSGAFAVGEESPDVSHAGATMAVVSSGFVASKEASIAEVANDLLDV